MAEFCLGCYNRLHHKNLESGDVVLSGDKDLQQCECCTQYRPVVVRTRARSVLKLAQFWRNRAAEKLGRC